MDPELDAMQKIAEVLGSLDKPAQERVLSWAMSRFAPGIRAADFMPEARNGNGRPPNSDDVGKSDVTFSEFADLFHAVNPSENSTKALVAAYWLARGDGEAFTAQSANGLLKDMGYHVPNITDALTQCMREKPAMIIQTRKSGSSRQARKLYKLTDAGKRRIANLIELHKQEA